MSFIRSIGVFLLAAIMLLAVNWIGPPGVQPGRGLAKVLQLRTAIAPAVVQALRVAVVPGSPNLPERMGRRFERSLAMKARLQAVDLRIEKRWRAWNAG